MVMKQAEYQHGDRIPLEDEENRRNQMCPQLRPKWTSCLLTGSIVSDLIGTLVYLSIVGHDITQLNSVCLQLEAMFELHGGYR